MTDTVRLELQLQDDELVGEWAADAKAIPNWLRDAYDDEATPDIPLWLWGFCRYFGPDDKNGVATFRAEVEAGAENKARKMTT